MGKGQATLQCYNEFTESAGKNMKSKFKKHCFLLILMASSLSLDAQNYGKLLTVELSATIQASPASITLNHINLGRQPKHGPRHVSYLAQAQGSTGLGQLNCIFS